MVWLKHLGRNTDYWIRLVPKYFRSICSGGQLSEQSSGRSKQPELEVGNVGRVHLPLLKLPPSPNRQSFDTLISLTNLVNL
jgi:hypothetical protein